MASIDCVHNSGVYLDPDVPVIEDCPWDELGYLKISSNRPSPVIAIWYQLSGVPIAPVLMFTHEAEDSNRKLEALGDRARWVPIID